MKNRFILGISISFIIAMSVLARTLSYSNVKDMKPTSEEAESVSPGSQHLNGVQAVTYARIRQNVGGDYARTDRQREVVEKLLQKAKKSNAITLGKLAKELFPQISTDFSLKKIIKLATSASKYSIVGTKGYPFESTDGRVAGIGSVVIPLGHAENVEELHEYLYPKNEYVPSDTVKDIAAQIESASGYTRSDYVQP